MNADKPRCCNCNRIIPKLRIYAIGETPYCVRCSPTSAKNDLRRMVMTPNGEK